MGKGARIAAVIALLAALAGVAAWWLLVAQDDDTRLARRAGATAAAPLVSLPTAGASDSSAVSAASGDSPAPQPLASEAPAAAPAEVAPVAFTGRVVDTAGRPLPDAVVRHFPSERQRKKLGLRADWFEPPIDLARLASTRTGADGRFTLAVVDHPPDAASIPPTDMWHQWEGLKDRIPALVVVAPGMESRSFECLGWRGGRFDAGDLVLGVGASIRGRVVDEERQPLDGVSLHPPLSDIHVPQGREEEWTVLKVIRRTETGADGHFALDGLWPGAGTIGLDAAGRPPAVVEYEAPAGGVLDLGDIMLGRGAVLEGFLLDRQGQPVPGARVLARPAHPYPGEPEQDVAWEMSRHMGVEDVIVDVDTTSDDRGAFRLEALDDWRAPYYLYAAAPGFQPLRSEELQLGGKPITLTLERAASIVLTVVDPETGAPVTDAQVEGQRATGAWYKPWMPLDVTSEPRALEAAGVPPPHAGVFLLSAPGPLGNTAIVSAPGRARRGYVLPRPAAPERAGFRVKLPREARVGGLVLDAREQPIAGATVTLTAPPSLRVDLPLVTAKTAADGRFVFTQLAGGDWELIASAARCVPSAPLTVALRKGQAAPDVRVVLQPAGAIAGVVLAAGRPLPGAEISAQSVAQAEAERVAKKTLSVQEFQNRPPPAMHRALADAQGRFTLEDLAPDAWELTGPPGAQLVAQVEAGKTTEVTLVARVPPRVRGRVIDAAGPVAGTGVQAVTRTDAQYVPWLNGPRTVSDLQGLFELELPAPGHVRLAAHQEQAESQPVELYLDWEQSEWIELRFPGGIVRGRVVEADGGAPVAKASVRLADGQYASGTPGRIRGPFRSTRTNADGRFEFTRVPGGAQAIFVEETAHVEPPATLVEVPADEAAPEVLVSLARGGQVKGHVHSLGGAALPRMYAHAVPLDGQAEVSRAGMSGDGEFVFVHMQAGRWRCELVSVADQGVLQAHEVQVAAGEVVDVEFSLPP